jgi:hypothetical protein
MKGIKGLAALAPEHVTSEPWTTTDVPDDPQKVCSGLLRNLTS